MNGLQVLDGENWAEQLAQLVLRRSRPCLLIKQIHALSPIELQNFRQALGAAYPATSSITGLDAALNPTGSAIPLADWDPQVRTWTYVHLSPPALGSGLTDLIEIVARLRAPDGCPWDRVQTPPSLIPYILEEAYETVAAIRSSDPVAIAEELGDLLLQVVLQSQIFSESQTFDLDQVAAGIAAKLIRRHPHVFARESQAEIESSQIQQTWEQIKQSEQPQQTLAEKLLHISQMLPPLMAALKISQKVARVGFEWPDIAEVWAKVAEEEAELREALAQPTDLLSAHEKDQLREWQTSELGDLLFSLVNIGRWYGLDPAAGLQGTNERFARRLQEVERLMKAAGSSGFQEHSLAELETFWQQAKQALAASPSTHKS